MKSKLAWLPNLLTMMNLCCGFIAILYAIQDPKSPQVVGIALVLIFSAWIFDFFDGALARLLGVSCAFGKELDSLADLVSCGVAPAVLVYLVYHQQEVPSTMLMAAAAGFFACCAAGRLARYNANDTGKKRRYFTGVPVEIGAMFAATVIMSNDSLNEWVALGMILTAGILMISTLRFPDAKHIILEAPIMTRIIGVIVIVVGIRWIAWSFLIPISYVLYGLYLNIFPYHRHLLDGPPVPEELEEDEESVHPAV